MRKILANIFTVIAILIIIGSIVFMISGTIALHQNKPIFVFHRAIAVVPTESMIGDRDDSLDVNDIVIIRQTTIDNVDVGDVIVFQGVSQTGEPILIIHRVIDETDDGFITQGDNNTQPDQPEFQNYVTEDNFQGVYDSKITFMKPVAEAMTSFRSLIFLGLGLVLLMLLVSEVIHLIKAYQEEKNETLKKAHDEEMAALRNQLKEKLKQEMIEEESQK